MPKPIADFIKSADYFIGYGYYESDQIAVRDARTISRSQKRKWQRYGIVPVAFFRYLEKINAIPKHDFIKEKDRTIYFLLDLLWETPKRNGPEPSEGEHLRMAILKDLGLLPKYAAASSQHLYIKGELYNCVPHKWRYAKKGDQPSSPR